MDSLSSRVAFSHETSNHPSCSVLTVKCITQFLSRRMQLLLKSISSEHLCVPFVLKGREQARYGGERRWPRLHDACLLQLDEIVNAKLFAVDRVGAVLGDVSFNQATLEDIAYTYSQSFAHIKPAKGLD